MIWPVTIFIMLKLVGAPKIKSVSTIIIVIIAVKKKEDEGQQERQEKHLMIQYL